MSAEYNKPVPHCHLSQYERLIRRSQALHKARDFFFQQGLVETDCLILGRSAAIDLHIDVFHVPSALHQKRYLFTSPEYPMKRLLIEGAPDIFYLGHVFRHEESGQFHSPEFTMAEWYRIGISFEEMIQHTLEFILHTLRENVAPSFQKAWQITHISYENVFIQALGINPHSICLTDLKKWAHTFFSHQALSLSCIDFDVATKDDILHLLMSLYIEPSLQKEAHIVVITHYPSTQAALAKKIRLPTQPYEVSERFEIYVEGVEIANGYHELVDPKEQRTRFETDNKERSTYGKEPYPLDERFLASLEKGTLPDCCGVAVGFDRLLMKAWNASHIREVQPIGWDEA